MSIYSHVYVSMKISYNELNHSDELPKHCVSDYRASFIMAEERTGLDRLVVTNNIPVRQVFAMEGK